MPEYNFTMKEFVYSTIATQKNIPNEPDKRALHRIWYLVEKVLQPTRDNFGPLLITSGYRSPKLNTAVKGSEKSAHLFGAAADFQPMKNATLTEIAYWMANNLEFDQLIIEYPPYGWIHVAIWEDKENRNEILLKTQEGYFNLDSEDILEI